MIRTWGEKRVEPKLKNHVDLVELLGIADIKKGINSVHIMFKLILIIIFSWIRS